MSPDNAMPAAPRVSSGLLWTGRAMSALVIAFLLFDGVIKLLALDVVLQALAQLGYPPSMALARSLGGLTLVATLLYAWPRTSLLGAILLNGLLGGAMATHLRAGSPLFTHLLFGAYLGLFAWGGLWLRSRALRSWLPWTQSDRGGSMAR